MWDELSGVRPLAECATTRQRLSVVLEVLGMTARSLCWMRSLKETPDEPEDNL